MFYYHIQLSDFFAAQFELQDRGESTGRSAESAAESAAGLSGQLSGAPRERRSRASRADLCDELRRLRDRSLSDRRSSRRMPLHSGRRDPCGYQLPDGMFKWSTFETDVLELFRNTSPEFQQILQNS